MRNKVELVNQSGGDTAHAVFEAVHSVMHALRSKQYRALKDSPYDLSHLEGKALAFFAHHPGATLSDLVARSGRDKGQTARLIAALRDMDLLTAQADERDRRSTRLTLSPQGQTVHALLEAQEQRLSAAAIDGMTAEECAQLIALLGKVRANLDEAA
ncbi:MarR family winged helix-turn-helix transcriptional regulator [Aquabacterium sp.]|uniref:MarR family winged helix-turn-helix transcriptional regulator n=1 Tax=Aquabacterium sp. TaxID=1872578 RepID=UPI0035B477C2